MSTYYGIACATCRVQAGCGSRTADHLFAVIHLAPLLVALEEADEFYDVQIAPNGWWLGEISPTSFVIDHKGHELIVYDEYGVTHRDPDRTVDAAPGGRYGREQA